MIIIFFLINICFSLIHQFDEDNAFALLEKQCEFGPRYPGSIGHEEFSEYLINVERSKESHMNVNYNFLLKLFSELTNEQKIQLSRCWD